MPQRYANTRKLTTVGNSAGVTLPKDYLRERGLIDDDGELRDAECEVEIADDGGIKFRPLND